MKGRQVDGDDLKEMNRLYALEANFTLTGGMADHRLRIKPGQVAAAAVAVAAAVGADTGGYKPEGALSAEQEAWIKTAAADLAGAKGEALVVAGTQQPAVVHALAAAVNVALGAVGHTLDVVDGQASDLGDLSGLIDAIAQKKVETLIITTDGDPVYDAPADLHWAAAQKDVANVIHVGVRHLTATARAADWHVPGAHYLESWGDVRAADGTYSIVQPMILPLYGGLSEIDILAGLLTDPAPAPADSDAAAPVPGAAAPEERSLAYEAVRATFATIAGDDFEEAWNLTLRDGFLAGSAYQPSSASFKAGAIAGLASAAAGAPVGDGGFEIAFRPDSKVWDGRYINNGWQQEAPDPVTKLTWDNAALISLRTAQALGIERDGQVVKVEAHGRSAHFPVIQAPGHADDSLTIPLGYGQTDAGRVGAGTGFDVTPIRHSASPYATSGAKVTVLTSDETVGDTTVAAFHPLATTAEHQNMYGRSIVREGTAERLSHDPAFAKTEGMDSHIPENISLYKPTYDSGEKKGEPLPKNEDGLLVNDPVHQWGMTIDLNQCIGCTSCLLACQSENNIPIVGKEQVMVHREMHWIRMDRYFATSHPDLDRQTQDSGEGNLWNDSVKSKHGDAEAISTADHFANPEMVFQPVACQQCELAPCETVCPVNATVHTPDGLNAMAYNRCIGTRYCANNCPYKARRFNFFDYNKRPRDEFALGPFSTPEKTGVRESLKLQKNPNVSVRMRGVMEKCTYCVQRVQGARIAQKRVARGSSDLQVPTGGVRTACQDACPADAIDFGNLLNPDESVTKKRRLGRRYDLLSYVGARPRTSYLARIKNPNPAIEADHGVGEISAHSHS